MHYSSVRLSNDIPNFNIQFHCSDYNRRIKFVFFLSYFVADVNHCSGLKNCVRCDKGGGTSAAEGTNASTKDPSYRCVKCVHLIVFKSRECVDKCPSGYLEEWSTSVDYMGRICKGK